MKRRVTVFQLARMRHLDLLALWHQLNPDGHEQDGQTPARMSKDWLVTAILQARPERT
jgi:hypothetical protein